MDSCHLAIWHGLTGRFNWFNRIWGFDFILCQPAGFEKAYTKNLGGEWANWEWRSWEPHIRFGLKAVLCVCLSLNRGTSELCILVGFSIMNHPFWGTPHFRKHPIGLWPMKTIPNDPKLRPMANLADGSWLSIIKHQILGSAVPDIQI